MLINPLQNISHLSRKKEDVNLAEIPLDPLTLEKERLKSLPKESSLSHKAFAILTADAFITNTGYEGQGISEQTAFWLSCWQRWQDPSYTGPCTLEMEKQTHDEITSQLIDFQELCTLFDQSPPQEICKAINNKLEQKGLCIIPLKTHAATNCDGHVFACILEQDDMGAVTAVIVNSGGGSEYHPLLKVDTHLKKSFMFDPILFNDRHLFRDKTELAEHFIKLLTAYSRLAPEDETKGYKITEIYQLFQGLGRALGNGEFPPEAAALSQRGGTCPGKAVKAIHRHYFFLKSNLDNYKKVIFFGKFQSFWDKYCQLCIDPSSFDAQDRALLKRSISQFAYSIEKHRKKTPTIIDDKTLLSAQALLELIDESLQVEKVKAGVKDFALKGNSVYPIQKQIVAKDTTKKVTEHFSPKPLKLSCPEPENLLSFLKEVQSTYNIQSGVEHFARTDHRVLMEAMAVGCIEALKILPIPKRNEQDSYWDAIKEEERFEIMQKVYELVSGVCLFSANSRPIDSNYQELFMMHLTEFAILDRLSSQNPEMCLHNCSYPLNIDTLNKYHYFINGSDQVRFQELQSYFKPNTGDLILFDIIPESAMGITLNDNDKACYDHKGCLKGLEGHLCYLDRLLPESLPKKAELYFTLMKGSLPKVLSGLIPKEYYLLQHSFFRVIKYLELLKDNQGLTPPFHVDSDHQSYAPPFDVFKNKNGSSGIRFWKKEKRFLACDGSRKLSPFLKESYHQALLQKIPAENQGIVNSFNEEDDTFAPFIRFELLNILKTKEMRATLAMKFCEDHPTLIELPGIKFLIQYSLLNDLALIEKIDQEPTFCKTLRTFIDGMIRKMRWNPTVESTLFWLQTAILVESQISEVTKAPIPIDRIYTLMKLIPESDAFQGEVQLTKALIAGMNPEDPVLIEAFINGYLLFHVYQADAEIDIKLTTLIKAQFLRHLPAIKEFFDLNGIQGIKTVLNFLNISPNSIETLAWPKVSFKDTFGKHVTVNFPLIFIDGEVLEHGDWPSYMRSNEEIATILHGQFPPIIKIGISKVIAQDGSFEIFLSEEDILVFKKRFSLAKKETALIYLAEENVPVSNIPKALKNQCEFWQEQDGKKIWMISKKEGRPIAVINIEKEPFIQKATPQGYPIKSQFLIQLPEDDPVSEHFAVIEDIKEICAWGSKEGKVDNLYFPQLNLSFQMEESKNTTKCLYVKNSEYYVTDNEEIANPLATALYLESAAGKKGMILPFNQIKSDAFGVNAHNVALSKMGEEHFFFELDMKSGLWRSSSELAMLFLIYTLKSHGRHEEAYQYLQALHPTKAFDEKQISTLLEILKNNHETRSLAIAIKAYAVYCQALKIGHFGSSKSEIDLKVYVLSNSNLDRIAELMGDDLNANRLSYSPTVSELIGFTHLSNGYHWNRFLMRSLQKNPPPLIREPSLHANNLEVIADAVSETIITSANYYRDSPKEKDFTAETIVQCNKMNIQKIAMHYLKLLQTSTISGSQQEMLKLELEILLERTSSTGIIVAPYFAVRLPHLFKAATEQGIFKSTVEKFLRSSEAVNLAKKIQIPKKDYRTVEQLPLKITTSEQRHWPVLIDQKPWKKLREEYKIPLQKLMEEYFSSTEKDIFKDSTFGLKGCPTLETAFDKKVAKTYLVHTLKKEAELQKLSDSLKNSAASDSGTHEKIQALLNYPSSQELARLPEEMRAAVYAHKICILEGKVQAPSFQKHFMPFLLSQDARLLKEANPFLSKRQLAPLYDLGIQYMLESSQKDQAKEALKLVDEAILKPDQRESLIQKAGVVLGKERHYNPYKYPEMLIYEYATGNMLRNQPDQARLLKKIIKTLFVEDLEQSQRTNSLKRLFFEFQAGGGKTKVLSVILAARAMREGKTPVFLSLPTLIDISKEDLREAFSQVYLQGILPLSVPLDRKLDEDDLKTILELLKTKDVCIVTEPETWHSLNLQLQSAYLSHDIKEGLLQEIMDYFKEKALFFIDEEHRNVSSLIEANKAEGTPDYYPDYAAELITDVYDLLYGWTEDPIILKNGQPLHAVLDLMGNKQATISEPLLKEILEKLAEQMTKLLNIPKNYFTHKNATRPDFKDELFEKKVDLARGLLLKILPFAFSQKDMMDYGPSPNTNDFVFDPYILGEPAGPKFQDPDIAAVLTVQGLRQHGLDEQRIKHYLKGMISKLKKVQESGETRTNQFMKEFEALNPPQEFPLEKIDLKSLENPLLLSAYSKALGKNRAVIKTFEKEIALKKIKIYPYKLTSTSQELSNGASAVVHTSATIGCREQNPYLEEGLFLPTDDFMADVVHRALLPHNLESHFIKDSHPEAFLEQLWEEKTDFSRVDGIINIGGMCREATPQDWAEGVFAFTKKHELDYAGAIIAKEERINGNLEKRLYIVRPDESDVLIEGSDVKAALQKLGLNGKRFFKVYPPDMATGTDLSLEENARMILTMGENVTLAANVQAIMRMRGFLHNPIDPKSSQGLIWVGSIKIQTMLQELYGEATPHSAMLHSKNKQDAEEKEAIKMRAKQDIEMVIRGIKHKKISALLKIPMINDPREKYGSPVEPIDAEIFLKNYAESLAKKAGLELKNFPEEKKRIEKAIQEVKQKVPFFETSTLNNFNAAMHQHQEAHEHTNQKVNQQQRQVKTATFNAKGAPEDNLAENDLRIGADTALVLPEEWRANRVLGVDLLSPNLYLFPNFINTIEHSNENLKTAAYILAVQDNGTKRRDYRLISAKDAAIYTKQLQNRKPEDNQQTAILFTSNGSIHQSDRTQKLTEEEIESWQQSEEFRDILAQVGLLNSKQIEEDRQCKLILEKPGRLNSLEKILKRNVFFSDEAFGERWSCLQNMLSSKKT